MDLGTTVSVVTGIVSAVGSVFTVVDYFRATREEETAIKKITYGWLEDLANRMHKDGLRQFALGDFKAASGYCDVALAVYTEIGDREDIPALRQDLADIKKRAEDVMFQSAIRDANMRLNVYDPQEQPTGQRRRS